MPKNLNDASNGYMGAWNAAHVILTINGNVIQGFGQDDMVNISYTENRQSFKQDPQGSFTKNVNNKTGATVTVNLDQMSPCRLQLAELLDNLDNFTLDYRDDAEHYATQYAFVNKDPDYQAGNTSGNRAWTITCLGLNHDTVAGNGEY